MKTGIFTNGVYDIVGFTFMKRLIGILVKSEYPLVHKEYKFINWNLYHTPSDIKPQFYKK